MNLRDGSRTLSKTEHAVAMALRAVAQARQNTAASLPEDTTPAEAYAIAFSEAIGAVEGAFWKLSPRFPQAAFRQAVTSRAP